MPVNWRCPETTLVEFVKKGEFSCVRYLDSARLLECPLIRGFIRSTIRQWMRTAYEHSENEFLHIFYKRLQGSES